MVGSRYVGASGAALWVVSSWLAACGGATGIEVDGAGNSGGTGGAAAAAAGGKASAGGTSAGGRPAGSGGRASGGAVASSGGKGTGGNGSTWLFAKEFDQRCTYDSDCILVVEGDQCALSYCATGAISTSASSLWYSRSKNVVCGPSAGPSEPSPECAPVLPACYGGTCMARASYTMDPSKYYQECYVDSDCTVVQAGEVCDSCGCTFGPISVKAVEQYEKDAAEQRQCRPPPSTCDCALPAVGCSYDSNRGGWRCVLH